MWDTVGKPALVYAGTMVLTAIGQRYHLSGDQMIAISSDVAAAGAAIYGVAIHHQASKNGGEK